MAESIINYTTNSNLENHSEREKVILSMMNSVSETLQTRTEEIETLFDLRWRIGMVALGGTVIVGFLSSFFVLSTIFMDPSGWLYALIVEGMLPFAFYGMALSVAIGFLMLAFSKNIEVKKLKYIGAGDTQEAVTRFRAAYKAVQEIVDPSVATETIQMMKDLQKIREAAEWNPKLFADDAEQIAQVLTQTLVVGSIIRDIHDYRNTRIQIAGKVKGLQELQKQETNIINELGDRSVQLVSSVQKTALELSIVRGEILQIQAMAIQGENRTKKLKTISDKITATCLATQEIHKISAQTLVSIQ